MSTEHPLCAIPAQSSDSNMNIQGTQSLVTKGRYVSMIIGETVWHSQYLNVFDLQTAAVSCGSAQYVSVW